MNLICPVCRSNLKANGHPDFSGKADSLQVLNCPVCTTPISLASGFPVPTQWDSFTVVTRREPVVTWEQVKQQIASKGGNAQSLSIPSGQSIYAGTDIFQSILDAPKFIAKGVGDVAGTALEATAKGAGGAASGLLDSTFGKYIILFGLGFLIIYSFKK